jgi:adenosylcobinamide-GDP ribazoletransferase
LGLQCGVARGYPFGKLRTGSSLLKKMGLQTSMNDFLRALRVAFGFLTTLPVPLIADWRDDDLRLAVRAYPVVGLVIGVILTLPALLPSSSLLQAVLTVALWLAVTGALHFDGFCDLADAALVPKTPEERWQIVKDPRIGSFALMAGVLLILTKVAALSEVLSLRQTLWHYAAMMVIVPVLARSSVTWAMARFPVYDASLLGRRSNLRWDETYLPIGLGLLFAIFIASFTLTSLQFGWLILACIITTPLLSHWLNRRMSGLGGDAYGAIIEINEAVLLVVLSLIM